MGKTNDERPDISAKNIVYQEGKKVFSRQQFEDYNSANEKTGFSCERETGQKKKR
jgi:hypothetical protein